MTMGCLNFESRQDAHTIEQAAIELSSALQCCRRTAPYAAMHKHDSVNVEQFAILRAPSVQSTPSPYAALHNDFSSCVKHPVQLCLL